MARRSGIASRFVRVEIEEALAHGATLETIERDIVDGAAVSDDARAALWLYAWGASERRDRGLPPQPAFAGRASLQS
jgi:hypothetical protein